MIIGDSDNFLIVGTHDWDITEIDYISVGDDLRHDKVALNRKLKQFSSS